MTLQEMLQKRAGIVQQMRDISARYADGQAFSAEDQQAYDRMFSESQELNRSIQNRERLDGLERTIEGEEGGRRQTEPRQRELTAQARDNAYIGRLVEQHRTSGGFAGMDPDSAATLRQRMAFERDLYNQLLRSPGMRNHAIEAQLRDLSVGTPTQGGNTVLPLALHSELIDRLNDVTFMRGLANVLPPLNNAESIGVMTIDSDTDDADWTTELSAGTSDSGLAFGRRELKPEHLAKRTKISRRLIQISSADIVGVVLRNLGYKFGITGEKAMMTGNGSGQPLGVFYASSTGIPTARDTAEDMGATTISADGIINLHMHLKPQYRQRASYIMHTNMVKQVLKLKDKDDQYLFRPSMQAGVPDLLNGRPLYESVYAPSAAAPGAYAAIFGDFSFYAIQDSFNMEILRLDELFAGTYQVGYDGHFWTDAMPIHGEAFSRLKFATGS